ncbi:hypothetical protein [Pseudomonas sp. S1(2024)]|uniref:hypothetical protein n=1 Tax=Pseudomonas sp. S1(2024) TaxID=3390191 RepID=UPI003978AE02
MPSRTLEEVSKALDLYGASHELLKWLQNEGVLQVATDAQISDLAQRFAVSSISEEAKNRVEMAIDTQ